MELLIFLLIAIGLLVIAGVGLVASRSRSLGRAEAPPATADTSVEVEADSEIDTDTVEALVEPSFRDRLGKARSTFTGYLGAITSRSSVDDETWDQLEEALIRADVGVATTNELLEQVKSTVAEQGITDPEAMLDVLKAQMKSDLEAGDRSLHLGGEPSVWLFVGVNGVGKTTTIGKLAHREISDGQKVVLAAGDTFRAAAAEQLEMWSEKAGADFVRGAEGSDPGAVVFDAVEHAANDGSQIVMADTAGRLHTNSNLMEELRKVRRVAEKGAGTVSEVLLVLDATTGQNGLVQASQFTEAVDVSGVVLTKLDGSAKGGIVFAVQTELGIPVKLVGLGEGLGDLVEFESDDFVEALFA
jgi:fused signal recognition particle receptor